MNIELGFMKRENGMTRTAFDERPELTIRSDEGQYLATVTSDRPLSGFASPKEAALAFLDEMGDAITDLATEVMERDDSADRALPDFEDLARAIGSRIGVRYVTLDTDEVGATLKGWRFRPSASGSGSSDIWRPSNGWGPVFALFLPFSTGCVMRISDRFRRDDGVLDRSLCIIDMEDETFKKED